MDGGGLHAGTRVPCRNALFAAAAAPTKAVAASAARGLGLRDGSCGSAGRREGGLSNREIRERLVLSEATVKTHVARLLLKTGSRDRAAAVALAYRTGFVHPEDPIP